MSNVISAIKEDYQDYVNYCKSIGIEPISDMSIKNFYDTKEWKDLMENKSTNQEYK